MTTQSLSPSPWRPTLKGHCDRRSFWWGYAAVLTVAFGNWVVAFAAAAMLDLFASFGVDANFIFGFVVLLAMATWPFFFLVAGLVYLPALIVRRARSITLPWLIACIAVIMAAAWFRYPSADFVAEKGLVLAALRMMIDPIVIQSVLVLGLPPTRGRTQE